MLGCMERWIGELLWDPGQGGAPVWEWEQGFRAAGKSCQWHRRDMRPEPFRSFDIGGFFLRANIQSCPQSYPGRLHRWRCWKLLRN